MQVHLRPRLAVAAAYLSGAGTVADIGCDHGRLAVALLQQGAVRHVIASDLSADSLQKARALAARCNVGENALSFFVSDGLSHLTPGEADALVFDKSLPAELELVSEEGFIGGVKVINKDTDVAVNYSYYELLNEQRAGFLHKSGLSLS